MQVAPIPLDEPLRINSLRSMSALDQPPEERFDRISRMAQILFDIPYVYISLVDENRVWIKSQQGSSVKEFPRDISFCSYTICNVVTDNPNSRITEIKNISLDQRFHDHPYLSESNPKYYYIGFVLQSEDKRNVGVLCMLDTRPRSLSEVERTLFMELGFMAEAEFNRKACESPRKTQVTYAEYLLTASDSARKVVDQFSQSLKNKGICFKEWRILNEIITHRVTVPNQIALKLQVSSSFVTRLLDLLEAKGMIERKYGANQDRRTVRLVPTEAGIRTLQYGVNHANSLGEKFSSELGLLDLQEETATH